MRQPQRILAVVTTLAAIFFSPHSRAESPVESTSAPDFAADSGEFSGVREGTYSFFEGEVFQGTVSIESFPDIEYDWDGVIVKANRIDLSDSLDPLWLARASDGSIHILEEDGIVRVPSLLFYPANPFAGQSWTNIDNGETRELEVISLNATSPGGIDGCVLIREIHPGDWSEDIFFKDGAYVGNTRTDLIGNDPDEAFYWSIEILLDDTTLGNSVTSGDSVTQDGVTMQVVSVLATDGGASAAVDNWGVLFGTDSTSNDVVSLGISFNTDVRILGYEIGSREDVPSGMYLTITGTDGVSGQNSIPPIQGFIEEEITLPYVPGTLSVLKAGQTYTITHNLLDATNHDPLFNLEALYVIPVESGSAGDPYTLTISDDFNAPSLNTIQWTPDDAEGASLIQSGGTLNYATTTPGNDNYALLRFSEPPGYDDTWEVIVDVTNTAARSTGQYTGGGVIIKALENADFREDQIFFELGNENKASTLFYSNFVTDGIDIEAEDDELDTGETNGSMRITYNGATKVFSIWVDRTGSGDGFQWELLSSYGIAGSGGIRNTDWNMTTAGSFGISLFGLSGGSLNVTSGQVTLDNFVYQSNSGGGGGSFEGAIANAGLTGPDALPNATPFNDGVANLLKFAFNMNLAGPDSHRMASGGSSGLPGGDLVEDNGQTYWRVEYVRRKNSGLNYVPQKSSSLEDGSFTPMTGEETVTDIPGEPDWERVVIDEPCDPATEDRCFSRVGVTME